MKKALHNFFEEKRFEPHRIAGVFAFFLGIVIIYCLPILKQLKHLGLRDWDYFLFLHKVARISILQFKQFPFWNPYYCGGAPFIGHLHVNFFSPSLLFTLFFDVLVGLRLMILFNLFLGMIGMFLLCRHLNIKGIAAMIPSVIFAFSGCLTLHITAGHLGWMSSAYLPFIFLFYLKSLKQLAFVFAAATFLSMIFFEGSGYILIFTAVLLGLFSFMTSVQRRSARPLIAFICILFLFILFSGPKLFPMLEFMANQKPRLTDLAPYHLFHPICLYDIFLGTLQSISQKPVANMPGWWEFGSYIGIIPAVLFILSLTLIKKHWPLIVTAIVFFLISMGNFASFSPWGALHKLPVFENMHISSRAFIFLIFLFSILSGIFLNISSKKLSNKNALKNTCLLVILCVITFDLIKVNSPIFKDGFSGYQAEDISFKKYDFKQLYLPRRLNFLYGGATCMFPIVIKNQGVANGYEALPIRRFVLQTKAVNYKGEYYLLDGNGKISQDFWSPNKLTFRYNITKPETLVINQNFDKNWKSTSFNPPESYNGLLSIQLLPEKNEITLYYFPLSFICGLISFSGGLLLMGLRRKFGADWNTFGL